MLWGRGPKIAWLGGILAGRWGAIVADFRRFYGLSARAVIFGPDAYDLAEVLFLVEGLEHYGGALAAALNPHAGWGHEAELLATNAELIAHLCAIAGKAWLKDYTPPKLTIRRPWEDGDAGRATMSTREEFATFLAGAGKVRVSKPRTS